MGRAFVYVILGGGVAAGYAALEFTNKGVSHGELCIISEEPVAPYERPALSKGFLLPEAPARLPAFHTCVGANEERLTPKWYKEHGIELILGTRVKSADVRRKTLLTAAGETISYKFLIVKNKALNLEEFGVSGSDAENVCHLRDLADATRLVDVMQASTGGNAVVIGGGYIGMEVAASLVINKINVSMVFPEPHCMARLFTPKIASYFEEFYKSKGVKFVKGTVMSSFVFNPDGKVTGVNLKDGSNLPADLVVVGIGIRPNTSLFEGQLTLEKGGIKVNSQLQTSNSSVYAVGDVASFPVKIFGEIRRLEHVDAARKSARHAVAAIMEADTTPEFDYLPFFYSRFFSFSWQFYELFISVTFRELVSVLIGSTKVFWLARFSKVEVNQRSWVCGGVEPETNTSGCGWFDLTVVLEKPVYPWHAAAGVVAAASIAAFAYWYGRRRRRW
ncbi:hypothetical protein R6Q57_026661 [Mikania cordata]